MKTNQPQINEIVNYLDANDKLELENLKTEFPKFQHFLEPGIMLGDDSESYSEEEEYKFRLTVSKRGLKSVLKEGNNIFVKLQSKLIKLNKIDFYSQILTLISGGAILIMVVKDFGSTLGYLKYIAPLLVLIGSLLSLYAKNKAQSFIGGNENLYQLTNKFIGYETEGKYLISEIEVSTKYYVLEKAKPIVESADVIIQKVNDFILRAS